MSARILSTVFCTSDWTLGCSSSFFYNHLPALRPSSINQPYGRLAVQATTCFRAPLPFGRYRDGYRPLQPVGANTHAPNQVSACTLPQSALTLRHQQPSPTILWKANTPVLSLHLLVTQ
jgi:hypothetical protein